MPYTPINADVFVAAFTGALGGMAVGGGWITNPDPTSYANIVIVVGAYAEAIDHAWNNPAPISDTEYDKIQCVTEQLFVGRGAQPDLDPNYQLRANWDTVAAAVVALVQEADGYLNSLGINPSSNGIRRARGVVIAPLPTDLTQFLVAASPGNDGIAYVAGDTVLAIGETTNKARSGPWVITTVAAGKGTLVRPSWWAHGAILQTSGVPIEVGSEGSEYSNTRWRAMGKQGGNSVTTPTNTFVVDTDNPGVYPEIITTQATLTDGVVNINMPILSTWSGVAITDIEVREGTTAYYQAVLTAGDVGSGAHVQINARTGEGAVDTNANNHVLVTLNNQALAVGD